MSRRRARDAGLVAILVVASAVRAEAADVEPPPDGAALPASRADGASDGGVGGDGPADATSDAVPDAARAASAPVETLPAAPVTPPVPVRGTVLARGGHRKLRQATVMIDGRALGETDATGGFEVAAVPGRHHLQVAASGFQPIDLVVDVAASGWTGAIRLSPGGPVYETVVAARQPTAAVRVSGADARTTAGTGGDPFRVIESLPGVSQVVWPFAIYAIRGANPGNTGFFLDGMRVPALFHFALGPSIVHPYLVDKLSFYPGGYPARFGGYVSGAVAAETAPPPNDITRFSADVRLYDAGGLAASPWDGGRGTIAVAARYSFTGLLISRLFKEVKFGYADYQLRADHLLGGGRITLLAIGSYDSLDIQQNPIGGGNGIGDASLDFHRVDLRWERPAAGGRLLARVTFATDDAHSHLLDSPIAVRAYTVAPRIAYARPVSTSSTIEVGVDGEAQHFRTDAVIMPNTPPLGDLAHTRGALTSGVYAAATLAWKRLALDPGLRYAFYAEQGTTRGALEPRLTARVNLGAGTALEATAGRFSQMPSLPLGVAGFEAFGLRDYGLQTSTQTSAGVETRLPAELTVKLTGFYQWLLVSDLRSTFSPAILNPDLLDMRTGRGYGAEVLLRLPDRARVHGWLAYTLSWSVRDFDGVFGPSDWDQRHILNLVGAVNLNRDWSVGGRFHFNSGRPYPVETQFGTVDYYRLPAFWQLDLRVDRRVVFDRATFDFYLDLANLTLTREIVALQIQEGATTPTEVGFRIPLPSLGVHAEW